MSTKTIENFFIAKTRVIPSNQRDYVRRERNVDDLFADVQESLEAGGGHIRTRLSSRSTAVANSVAKRSPL